MGVLLPGGALADGGLVGLFEVGSDFAALLQPVNTGHHDRVARIQTGGDLGVFTVRGSQSYVANGYRLVGLYQKDVRGTRVSLNCRASSSVTPRFCWTRSLALTN